MGEPDVKSTERPQSWRFIVEVPEEQGRTVHRDWVLDLPDDLYLGGVLYKMASPVYLSVDLSRDSRCVRMSIGIKTSIIVECCRCLSTLELALDENFGYCYVSQPDDDESDEMIDPEEDVTVVARLGKTLDISDALWECLVVSMPPFPSCPEGCASLGPVTTREEGEAADPRFQILADKIGGCSCKGGNSSGNSKE